MSTLIPDYDIIKEIGKGSFALVYLALHSGQQVAIKSISRDKLKGRLQENVESEIKILKEFRHENIVRLFDIVKTESHIHLVMEYCSMGDLSQFIKNKGPHKETIANSLGGLVDSVVFHFLRQLASAMEFLRSKSLIHRDLKPQNILLAPSDTSSSLPWLKLADFGFARLLPSQSLASTLCGSPLYMAPEILRGDAYDAKADLWSVGAIAYEMCYGRPPFRAQNHIELLRKIEKTAILSFPDDAPSTSSRPRTVEKVDASIKDFIVKLLKKNPIERITFEEFFFHPCVKGFHSFIQNFTSRKVEMAASIELPNPSNLPFPGYQVNPSVFSDLFGEKLRIQPKPVLPVSTLMASIESVKSNPDESKSDDFVVVEKTSAVQVQWLASDPATETHKTASHAPIPSDTQRSYQEPPYLFCPGSEKILFLSQEAQIPYLTKEGLKDELNAFEDMDTLNLCVLHAYSVHCLASEYDPSTPHPVQQCEAVNLYLGSLCLYQLAMDLSRTLWSKFGQEPTQSIHMEQVCNLVQFIQQQFQICLERASTSTPASHGSTDLQVRSAEKLIFMRAVDLSNVGSINESLELDLSGCEMAYEQAIVLLEALLNMPAGVSDEANKWQQDASPLSIQMTDEDRGLIETLVASLYSKAEHVRQKMKQSGII